MNQLRLAAHCLPVIGLASLALLGIVLMAIVTAKLAHGQGTFTLQSGSGKLGESRTGASLAVNPQPMWCGSDCTCGPQQTVKIAVRSDGVGGAESPEKTRDEVLNLTVPAECWCAQVYLCEHGAVPRYSHGCPDWYRGTGLSPAGGNTPLGVPGVHANGGPCPKNKP